MVGGSGELTTYVCRNSRRLFCVASKYTQKRGFFLTVTAFVLQFGVCLPAECSHCFVFVSV